MGGIPATGVYFLEADYLGDASYLPAQSPRWGKTVDQALTTTTIQNQTSNPSLVSTAVTFTAMVDNVAPGAGLPTGSVTFSDGIDSCTVTAAPRTCSITFKSAGTRSVFAFYSGDANFLGSSSNIITQNVLATVNTEFSNASFIGPPSLLTLGQCNQAYRISALDVNVVTEVRVQYSVNDGTFASPTSVLLPTVSGDTWSGTLTIPATYPGTVYWRFVAIDGSRDWTYYDGVSAYTTGTGSYSDTHDVGVNCP